MLDDVLTNASSCPSANSFPDKLIAPESDMWSTVRLFLTLVQIIFSKRTPFTFSTADYGSAVFSAFDVIAGIGIHCWILHSLTMAVFNQQFTKFLQNEQWALVSSTGHLEHLPVPSLRSEKASACLSYSLLSPVPRMVPNVCLEDMLFTGMNEISELEPGASLWDSMRTRSLVGSEEALERRDSRDCLHLQSWPTEPCLLGGC